MELGKSTTKYYSLVRLHFWKILTVAMSAAFFGMMMYSPTPELTRKYPSHKYSTLIFGLATSMLVGNMLLPKGPIQGYLSFLWQSVCGISLFYLLGLVFMFFHVTANLC